MALKKIVSSSLQASHMCHVCATEIIPRINDIIAVLEARPAAKAAPEKAAAPKQRRTKKSTE